MRRNVIRKKGVRFGIDARKSANRFTRIGLDHDSNRDRNFDRAIWCTKRPTLPAFGRVAGEALPSASAPLRLCMPSSSLGAWVVSALHHLIDTEYDRAKGPLHNGHDPRPPLSTHTPLIKGVEVHPLN